MEMFFRLNCSFLWLIPNAGVSERSTHCSVRKFRNHTAKKTADALLVQQTKRVSHGISKKPFIVLQQIRRWDLTGRY